MYIVTKDYPTFILDHAKRQQQQQRECKGKRGNSSSSRGATIEGDIFRARESKLKRSNLFASHRY